MPLVKLAIPSLQIRTALLLALLATTGIACAGDTPTATIQTKAGPVVVDLEVADTPEKTQRGLMYRTELADGDGMLFIFAADADHSFWMKNTYISLDMIFIFADGRVHRIESRTEPESEKMISSGVPVRAVLELNANVANRLGLRPGDRINHPMFR